MPLPRNHNNKPASLRPPSVNKIIAEHEQALTERAMQILRGLRAALRGQTRNQQAIDRLYPLVSPKMAYGSRTGRHPLPVTWRPGHNCLDHNVASVLALMTAQLIQTYYAAVVSHEMKPFDSIAERLEEMLEVGLSNYKLAPAEPLGFVLMTTAEWGVEKARREARQAEIRKNREKLSHDTEE